MKPIKKIIRIALYFVLFVSTALFGFYLYMIRHEIFIPEQPASNKIIINDILSDNGETYVFAHQGDHFWTKPNSTESIQRALERGSDGVEIDIRFTEDSVPVLLHDPVLSIQSEAINVNSIKLNEILQEHPDIETLDSALNIYSGKIFFILELKSEKIENLKSFADSICSLIKKHKMQNHVILSSLNRELIQEISKQCSEIHYMYEINTEEKLVQFENDHNYRSPLISIGNYLLLHPSAGKLMQKYKILSVFTPLFDTEFEMIMTLKPKIIQTDRPGALRNFLDQNRNTKD
ncbi:MAG: glycerophosphodiester phosphodiesterase family protein [Spirochaetia bacterium]|nr:glycerophosphodiester phosphodiesterase family protein [Spirochaetia bacterium]